MTDLQRDIAEIEAALEKVHDWQREDWKRREAAWQRIRTRLTPDQERVAVPEGMVMVQAQAELQLLRDEVKALRNAVEAMRIAGGRMEFQAAFDAAKVLAAARKVEP